MPGPSGGSGVRAPAALLYWPARVPFFARSSASQEESVELKGRITGALPRQLEHQS